LLLRRRLNETERLILSFLLPQLNQPTYSSDPKLIEATKKSQPQLHRALRSLERLGFLSSSKPKPFRGAAGVMFWIEEKMLPAVQEILKLNGNYGQLIVESYMKRGGNPFFTFPGNLRLGIPKRTLQKYVRDMRRKGIVKRTKRIKLHPRSRRWRLSPAWELTRRDLTFWMKGDDKNE